MSFHANLCVSPSEAQIFQAIREIEAWKAPDPDDMPTGFF